MKKLLWLLTLISLVTVGCSSKKGTGALIGGAVGAGTGALIHKGPGAIVGGAIGIVGGALIGASLDDQDRKVMERTSPRTVERMDRAEPLTISDVIRLSQGGVTDETIVRYIQGTRTSYNLSQAQVQRLQNAGVSQRVINYMVDTGR